MISFSIQNYLPVFTLPMTLCTLMMMLLSTNQERTRIFCGAGGQMARCENMSYPEKQCWQNIVQSKDKEDWNTATQEEKEPTMKIDVQ